MADWNERYTDGECANPDPDPVVVEFASQLPPGRALDVACGPGRHAIWLAEHGWQVVAVDGSTVAIEMLRRRLTEAGDRIDCFVADLERHEFAIPPESYDLIVVCNYLQRDIFPSIKVGTRIGGVVIATIALVDDDPHIKPMNPAFLLNPGELHCQFEGWELLWNHEGKPANRRRARAEIAARRLA